MAVDAYVSIEYPDMPVFANTPSRFANYLGFNTKVGNSGTTIATGVTLVKTIVIPAGVTVAVIDNGGPTIGPENGAFISGPTNIQFVFAGLTLPAASGTKTTLIGIPITFADVSLTAPATITDISQVVASGDVNPNNNTALCNTTIA